MNSVIQCLAYTPGFGQFTQSLPNVLYQSNADGPFFLDSFARLFTQMQGKRAPCPDWFLKDSGVLQARFRGPFQQDAHEFFLALLDRFSKECLNAIEPEFISAPTMLTHYFTWHISTQVTCAACGTHSETDSEFVDWSLPVSRNASIAGAIDPFTSDIVDTPCDCIGARGSCTRRNCPVRYPLVMTVMLMRFDNQLRKIDDFVEFPEVMAVGERHYRLYAMIVHEGRAINRGHFFAYVRDEAGTWYKADDVCVFQVKATVVMRSLPYVLFYKIML
jgi:ubiquitin C-terminal hydrolase